MVDGVTTRSIQQPSAGSAMLRRFGWFYRLLNLGRMLSRVRFEEHSVDRIREAHNRGPVVYVLHERRIIDHLALNTLLNNRRLPLSDWNNGISSFYWQPVRDAWRDLIAGVRARLSGAASESNAVALGRSIASADAVTIWLDAPLPVWRRWFGQSPIDPLEAVLAAQTDGDRPVQIVPIVLLWRRSPERRHSTVRRFLEGAASPASPLRQLWYAWVRSRDALLQAGEPIDLTEVVRRVPEDRRLRTLRTLLRRKVKQEASLVRGPTIMPYPIMQRMVLDNPPMRAFAEQEAQALGMTTAAVQKRMAREYRSIAAHFRWSMIQVLYFVLQPLWTRVFSGVDVRPEDIATIRNAMRDGSIVLVPSHKSHFDYLLLSWVFYEHDFIVPHVVAGKNLAIWPLSIILRSVGGFFVARSFGDDRVHPTVFARYLRELIRQGYPVEFFLEGGRTRSGRLLPAKVGVLGMVLDAAEIRPRDRDVILLPLSLAYEQVAEEGAYARELGGEDKQPETVGQLVKARSVLKRRFGRVYLRVGTPISCAPLVDASDDKPAWSQRSRDERKLALHEIGERIIYRIGQATVLLPTSLVSLALLAHHKQGITSKELDARVNRLRRLLARKGAMESAAFASFDQAITQALDRLRRDGRIEPLTHAGERVWRIVPDERITLEFYKNQVLHFLGPAGLAALALRTLPEGPVTLDAIVQPFLQLVWVLRRELHLDPDRPSTDTLREGLADLVAYGALRADGDRLVVADASVIGEIYGLFRPLVESYVLVLRCVDMLSPPLPKRDFVKKVQQRGQALVLAGTLTRPEALSLVNLQHAVDAFREEGVLTDDGALSAHADLVAERLARLAPAVEP